MRALPRAVLPLLVFLATSIAAPVWALGQICGTITDAGSALPVEGAGVFVYTTAGTYTGFSAVSDAAGGFCINDIPAGTYDLQVLRDHYLTSHVRGIVVTDVTGVDVGLRPFTGVLFPPTPNPARDRVQLRFRLRDPGRIRLEVLDAQGRILKGWQDLNAAPGEHAVAWDLRDTQGRPLRAGLYFVRLDVNGSTTTRAFTRVP